MTRPLWTLGEIVGASGGRLDLLEEVAEPPSSTPITGISIDTRSIAPGDLFVPLTDARDGHAFVTAACRAGAAACLVRESYTRRDGDGVLLRVDDPLRALERIGMAARARLADAAWVIAVTGSAGKTGTKEMLRACLKVCASSPGKVHAPEKSFNNHWGVPLTLARMPADTGYAVFEIGMNHAGEIRPLTRMVRPHVAIVTNVLPVHVGNFPDGEIGVAKAKAEIFEGLEARRGEGRPSGTAIILRDSPHYELLREAAESAGARVVSFGRPADSDVVLLEVSGEQRNGRQLVRVQSHQSGAPLAFDMAMLGEHLACNACSVVAALEALGCPLEDAIGALAGVQSAQGRGARLFLAAEGGDILLLDESYNANPASMAAALGNLARLDHGGRRIAVMGDMLELGVEAERRHLELKRDAEQADLVFCCGPNMKHLFDVLPVGKRGSWASSSDGLGDLVANELRPGDAVMVKGSLGSRMAPIVEAIKKRFAPRSERG